ncbi:hypothetical protein ACHWQZ_G002477 [Mnemiopsis leidyi]
MRHVQNFKPPKLNTPKLRLPLPGRDSGAASQDDVNSVSTEGLIAARPQLVNELLLKLVAVNSGIEEKLKGYEEKIEQYEKRIKELEGEEGPVLPALVESPEYRPLSIKSSEMTLLAKWELVEEKAGILLVSICIGALAFLGVTWLDIKNSDVTDSNTGWILRYFDDHGDGAIYVNQMCLTTALVFDLTSLLIWFLRQLKVFKYEDFRELHTLSGILPAVLLAVHFLYFQWEGSWVLLTSAPLYCLATGATFLVHVLSLVGAEINKVHCFRGDLRFVKTSPV